MCSLRNGSQEFSDMISSKSSTRRFSVIVCMLFFVFTTAQISDISLLDVLGVFAVLAVRSVLADVI